VAVTAQPVARRTGLAPARLVDRLASYGDRVALRGHGAGERGLSYAELAGRVREFAARLGTERRLVQVEGADHADAVVAYLGAHAAGCPVLLTGPDAQAVAATYDPDVTWSLADGLHEVRATAAHTLHPDLALLLSTSGTTGSPKLVRLSHRNLVANARAIVHYLGIRDTDVAPTVLPMHYCYGLSVVHSHLLAGASLWLTDASVVEPRFWDGFRRERATSLAGVPYTFELLDRAGFAGLDLPSLRYVTQAGGRMAPDDVRRYAALGRRRGWDLVVMYGQTEATARMAWLPPHLAAEAPGTIGIPIPGGSFTVEPLPERPLAGPDQPKVGELVYRGDNVMLGYAESPADLALGRTVTELRTGDVGHQREDGLWEVVGRRSRFAKVFGLRVDLDHVERVLAGRGLVAAAADGGDALVLGVCSGAAPVSRDRAAALVRETTGIPANGVRLVTPPELPRLPSGKTDYRALVALADYGAGRAPDRDGAVDVVVLVGRLLNRPDATGDDTFVGLGGDSLSYVEVSVRLEQAIGDLPPDWPTRPLRTLTGRDRGARRGRTVEGSVLLRALAIVAIVGTHANLFPLAGGAHVLLGVLGFNFGRFHAGSPRGRRTPAVARSVARIAVPSVLVIGLVSLWTPGLGWRQALLLNGLLGPESWAEPAWHYWFLEVALTLTVACAALLAVPYVDRLNARFPFGLPLGLALAGLVARYGCRTDGGQHDHVWFLEWLPEGDVIHRSHVLFWLFAIGWAAALATSHRHRVLLSLLVVATLPGFFTDSAGRDLAVALGLLVLVWVPARRLPSWLAAPVGVLAAASLWIYLVHWQVYPWLEFRMPLAATVLSLLAGVVAWRAWDRAGEWISTRRG
jgi:acyl-CoA synthetase (AMP-forming)/AMP-acid ligase II